DGFAQGAVRVRRGAGAGSRVRHEPGDGTQAALAGLRSAGGAARAAVRRAGVAGDRAGAGLGAAALRAEHRRHAGGGIGAPGAAVDVPRGRRPHAQRLRAPRRLHLPHARDARADELRGGAGERAGARDRARDGQAPGHHDEPRPARADRPGVGERAGAAPPEPGRAGERRAAAALPELQPRRRAPGGRPGLSLRRRAALRRPRDGARLPIAAAGERDGAGPLGTQPAPQLPRVAPGRAGAHRVGAAARGDGARRHGHAGGDRGVPQPPERDGVRREPAAGVLPARRLPAPRPALLHRLPQRMADAEPAAGGHWRQPAPGRRHPAHPGRAGAQRGRRGAALLPAAGGAGGAGRAHHGERLPRRGRLLPGADAAGGDRGDRAVAGEGRAGVPGARLLAGPGLPAVRGHFPPDAQQLRHRHGPGGPQHPPQPHPRRPRAAGDDAGPVQHALPLQHPDRGAGDHEPGGGRGDDAAGRGDGEEGGAGV
ncbi:MAG: hypothetical protein AVDCRST_MAG89-459, partial [uncultured Gemmatimonadetes bacterium]